MARKLSNSEGKGVWNNLKNRLGIKELKDERLRDFYNHIPGKFDFLISVEYIDPSLGIVPTDETILNSIKKTIEDYNELYVFFLMSEYTEEELKVGLNWEIPTKELTSEIAWNFAPFLEFYLYSINDKWLIYYHHEHVVYVGGNLDFVSSLERALDKKEFKVTPEF